MQTVSLIDYGSGNLCNVERAFKAVGADVQIGNTPEFVAKAELLVLPGVGAFNDCMNSLKKYNLIDPIYSHINGGKYFLGICVGMQVLANSSNEHGFCEGLGVIPGSVEQIEADQTIQAIKVPHIAWEQLNIKRKSALLNEVNSNDHVYFAHSYHFKVSCIDDEIASANCGSQPICGMVQKGNVFGTQFHPEKSGLVGLKILKNFIELIH